MLRLSKALGAWSWSQPGCDSVIWAEIRLPPPLPSQDHSSPHRGDRRLDRASCNTDNCCQEPCPGHAAPLAAAVSGCCVCSGQGKITQLTFSLFCFLTILSSVGIEKLAGTSRYLKLTALHKPQHEISVRPPSPPSAERAPERGDLGSAGTFLSWSWPWD